MVVAKVVTAVRAESKVEAKVLEEQWEFAWTGKRSPPLLLLLLLLLPLLKVMRDDVG